MSDEYDRQRDIEAEGQRAAACYAKKAALARGEDAEARLGKELALLTATVRELEGYLDAVEKAFTAMNSSSEGVRGDFTLVRTSLFEATWRAVHEARRNK